MPDASAPRDILAETMTEGRKVLVPMLAEMLKRKGVEEVPSAEERRRFWQRAVPPEQEAQMWAMEMANRGIAALVPGSPQALDIGLGISKRVYPDRWDMSSGEGRDTESAQAEWAARHARQGPPEPEQTAAPITEGTY